MGHLQASGHTASALTLPDLDPGDPDRSSRTLADQADALESALDAAVGGDGGGAAPVLVVHSGANAPATLVLDRRPDLVGHVVWVDSGPVADGTAFVADLPAGIDGLPLPPFEELGPQASLEGLDEQHLATFRARAVPQPATVMRAEVRLGDEARRAEPSTVVCCSIASADRRAPAEAGHPMFAEVARWHSW